MRKLIETLKKNKLTTAMGIVIVVLLAYMFLGTGASMSYEGAYKESSPMAYGMEMAVTSGETSRVMDQNVEDDRMVILSSSLGLEVSDIEDSFDDVTDAVLERGGYVSSSNIYKRNGYKSGYITVRVPKDEFYDVMSIVEDLGELESKTIRGDDVTEQFIDLEARLGNYKATEERYLELLDMAATVEEIVMIEDKLMDVRYQIEYLEGRIQYLENRVEMSTISINMNEPEPLSPDLDWHETFSDAVHGFFGMLQNIIVFVATWIPVAVLLAIGWIFYKKRKKVKK